jgi:HAD superfamily hydrolase (TIGR01509 family)
LSDEQVEAATQARQETFLAMLEEEPLPAFPGVLELMSAALSDSDFKVGIATSSTREKSEAVLKSAQIPYLKMEYVTGNDVEKKKPDPELFLTAARRLGLAPDQCVVIEDAPNGVAAAKAAGCRCIAVTNSTTSEQLTEADCVVNSLEPITIQHIMDLIEGA